MGIERKEKKSKNKNKQIIPYPSTCLPVDFGNPIPSKFIKLAGHPEKVKGLG